MQENQSDLESTDSENDVFCFETEHLALRGNKIYSNLLRTIAMLQAQRICVHQQITELEQTCDLYLKNPQLLIDKVQNSEPLIPTNCITTVKLPELPTFSKEGGNVKTPTSLPASTQTPNTHPSINANKKSDTFKQPWTNEEQRRLEQLLMEYPPEEVEMRRFSKIAKALGTRTPQQVFSRIQKYFQKLHDAGMPVPGRIPKNRRQGAGKVKFNLRRSTFFPAQNISMVMPEDDFVLDDLPPAAALTQIKTEAKTEIVAADENEAQRSRQLQLDILTAIHDEKVNTADGYNPDPLAPSCAECAEAAVTQARWRCNSCYCYLNLCGDCLADQLINKRFEHITHDVVVDQEAI